MPPSREVVILSGLPGSGKTTRAERMAHLAMSAAIVSADDAHIDPADGVYRFKPELRAESHRICWRAFRDALVEGFGLVIVDNTNLTAAEIAPYVLPAEAYGYDVRILRVPCVPAEAFARQTHGVPAVIFDHMVAAWEKRDVMPWWNVTDLPE